MSKILKYKLTDQDMKTHNGFQWELDKWVAVDGDGGLCSSGKLHYYHSAELAILLNPIHVDIKNPRLWLAECGKRGHLDDNGLKGGCNEMKLVKELSIIMFTTEQKIAFSILCGKQVYNNVDWNLWGDNWLNNKDRSANTSNAAAHAAANAANAAAYAAAHAAAKINLNKIAIECLKY